MREITVASLGAIALSTVAMSVPAAAQDALVRFGVIADPQYAPVPPRGTRYYANSLWGSCRKPWTRSTKKTSRS